MAKTKSDKVDASLIGDRPTRGRSALMSHRVRFMQEVRPGRWVVACRICPKRSGPPSTTMPHLASYAGGRATFASAAECHDWWRKHEASDMHQNYSPSREMRQHDRNLGRLTMSEFVGHLASGCEMCRPKRHDATRR